MLLFQCLDTLPKLYADIIVKLIKALPGNLHVVCMVRQSEEKVCHMHHWIIMAMALSLSTFI